MINIVAQIKFFGYILMKLSLNSGQTTAVRTFVRKTFKYTSTQTSKQNNRSYDYRFGNWSTRLL